MERKEERKKMEEETAEAGGELIRFGDLGMLMAAMVDLLDMLYPDAKRLIASYGAVRCEGAYWQTALKQAKGELNKPPIGWFRTTLRKGLEWTPEEIRLHFCAEHERRDTNRAVERMVRRNSHPDDAEADGEADSMTRRHMEGQEAKERERSAAAP